MKNLMQDDTVDLFCIRRRPRVDGEEKHVKLQYQSISALGFKQVQSACYMRSAVACQMQHRQYI
jgi:hypothetical protein